MPHTVESFAHVSLSCGPDRVVLSFENDANRCTWCVLCDTTLRYLSLVEDVAFTDGFCQKFESLSAVIETAAARCQDGESGNRGSRFTNRGSGKRQKKETQDISIGRTFYWYSGLSAALLCSLSEWLVQRADETQTRQTAATGSIGQLLMEKLERAEFRRGTQSACGPSGICVDWLLNTKWSTSYAFLEGVFGVDIELNLFNKVYKEFLASVLQ